MTGGPLLDRDAYRVGLATWLDEHDGLLTRQRQYFSLDLLDVATVQQEFQEELFAGGWVRYGWPEELGGLGGDARHRAALYDELGRRRVPIPESYLTVETLIPMLSVHAPALARAHLTDLLRGAERWCQGFSEPDAGSDLASLRTKAVRDGDDWIVDGHKIWTSQATVSQRCVVLLRTGTPESRHRGLSMMLVDHDTPGVEVREIRTMSGRDELGEVLFDGVRVGGDRLIGNDGDGWALAMYLLQWERGMYPWQRQAGLFATLDALLERDGDGIEPRALADAYLSVLPMRLSAASTIRRLAAGETPGPEVSVDKVLLARAELVVFDLVDTVLDGAIELDDDEHAQEWRHDYLFSRSAPIYGGSYEIQRQILADRVLGMPRVVEVTTIDRDTLDIFERTARGVLAQPDVDAGAALEEIGWRDFLAADPASVVPLMFGLLGERVLASCALDDVAFAALGLTGEELRAAGHTFAHPRVGAASTRSAGEITVDALVRGGRRDVPVALVVDERVVTIAAGRLEWVTAAGIDPQLGLARVRGVVANGDIEVYGDVDGGAVAPACRRALAHELLGATDAMLAMATDYAKVRQQFGQPIGAFQAVKHRLADVYVARQAASAVIDESWRSDPECTTVAAKALAAHAGALASENCLQVLGAIGFTLEHDLHRYVRRVRVLDRFYGAERDLRTELGRLLQARGRVPRPGAA